MELEERANPRVSNLRFSGDAAEPAPSGASAPVWDEARLANLVGLMGSDWVAKALGQFAIDVEARLRELEAASARDLAEIAHKMTMMAAHCGFVELLGVLETVQREARQGAGESRIPELRAAGARALAAMRSYMAPEAAG